MFIDSPEECLERLDLLAKERERETNDRTLVSLYELSFFFASPFMRSSVIECVIAHSKITVCAQICKLAGTEVCECCLFLCFLRGCPFMCSLLLSFVMRLCVCAIMHTRGCPFMCSLLFSSVMSLCVCAFMHMRVCKRAGMLQGGIAGSCSILRIELGCSWLPSQS